MKRTISLVIASAVFVSVFSGAVFGLEIQRPGEVKPMQNGTGQRGQLQDQMKDQKGQFQDQKGQFQDQMKDQKGQFQDQKGQLQDQMKDQKGQFQDQRGQLQDQMKDQRGQFQDQKGQFQDQMKDQRGQFQDQKGQFQDQMKDQKGQFQDQKGQLQDQMKDQRGQFQDQKGQFQDQKDQMKDSVKDDVYGNKRRSVRDDVYENKIKDNKLDKNIPEEMQKKMEEMQKKMDEMKQKLDEMKQKLEDMREKMKDQNGLSKEERKDMMKELVGLRNEANDKTMPVFVNGQDVIFDAPPIIKDGRTLIPVRAVSTALGADVKWDEATKTITVTKAVYNSVYGKSGPMENVVVIMKLDSKEVTINGKLIKIEVPAKSYEGRVLIPIRFLMEAFKKKIEWNAELKSVIIED